MKYLFFGSVFFFFTFPAWSQSVSVVPVGEHGGHDLSTFPVKDGAVVTAADQVVLGGEEFANPRSWSISKDGEKLALLTGASSLTLTTLDYNGKELAISELEFFDPADPTLKVYPFDDGRAIIRDNVVNFSFFDAAGEMIFSVSNRSGSGDGERISQLATDPFGKTVVLYNPAIVYGERTGSQARLVFGEHHHDLFFRDQNREIDQVRVTGNGAFITLLTSSGANSRVYLFDRFGNELSRIDFDEEMKGAVLSKNGDYLTVWSGGRVQVYRPLTGERLGSATSRTSILTAAYQPEDEVILAMGGSENNGQITEPVVTAVHLTKRQIAHEVINLSLSVLDLDEIEIIRQENTRFRITGLNQHLDVSATF